MSPNQGNCPDEIQTRIRRFSYKSDARLIIGRYFLDLNTLGRAREVREQLPRLRSFVLNETLGLRCEADRIRLIRTMFSSLMMPADLNQTRF